ncbi:MAG TPA: acylphosphatase [Chitinophagaceae bacterium]|nr:acylphosphatase [Chitinophagaceae bacterium]
MVNEVNSIRIIVSGKVQGVFFRKYTLLKARELGLTGEVMNLEDGAVSVQATGTTEQLNELIAFCRTGPTAARVSGIQVETLEYKKFKDFRIIK